MLNSFKEILVSKKFATIIFVIVVLFHLLTLAISPLPWFDEVLFADITSNFKGGGVLRTTVTPLYLGEIVVNLYGPVYFYLQAIITAIFGTSAFTFRLLNLFSSLFLIFLVKERIGREKKLLVVFGWLALLFSPLFIQNSHSGRMDLLAVCFVFLSFVTLFKTQELKARKVLLVSLLLSLTILTTPRAMFLTPGLVLFFIPFLIRRDSFLKAAASGILLYGLPVLVYCLWSYFSSGSCLSLIDEILHNPNNQSFLGSGFFRKKVEDFLFVLFCVYYIVVKWNYRNFTDLASSLALTVLIFQVLVKEVGPYGAMQVPFEVLGIIELSRGRDSQTPTERGFGFLLGTLVLVFVAIFFFKQIAILTHLEERNSSNVRRVLEKNGVFEKTVLAAFPYYYELLNTKNKVYNYEETLSSDPKEVLPTVARLNPDFLLVLKNDTSNFLVKDLVDNGGFKLLDSVRIEQPVHSVVYAAFRSRFSNKIGYNSYGGYLYRKAN